jgi:hypothetical protein
MPNAVDVKPAKWSAIEILFDDGEYSVISGIFGDAGIRCLGERWNGEVNTHGFPSQGGNPTWHVVPKFPTISLLHGVLDELLRDSSRENRSYIEAVLRELGHQQVHLPTM